MRRGISGALARDAQRAAGVSILCLVLSVLVGVGGFEHGGHPGGAVRVAPPSQQARAHRSPLFAPGAAVDPRSAPRLVHRAIVRRQMLEAFGQAQAEAAAEALRSQPLTLSVADAAPGATPELVPGTRVSVRVTYYYCRAGTIGPTGDGGGFCGRMANGAVVHPGAAACARVYLGQRFRIIGDPTGQTYTCEDTGSAVHGLHRDIWFDVNVDGRRWQAVVGPTAVIEILPQPAGTGR